MIQKILVLCAIVMILQGERDIAFAQATEPATDATASLDVPLMAEEKTTGDKLQREPGPPIMDLTNFAAQLSFWVFIVLFIGLYLLIRRQPGERDSRRKRKKL
ncbi:MAG: hypothetical protein ACOX5R_01130 [bacterium]